MYNIKSCLFLSISLISLTLSSQSAIAYTSNFHIGSKKPYGDHNLIEPVDLTNKTWTQSFLDMNQLMSIEYALTQHKKINWDQLKNKYLSLIITADKNNDKAAYYQALRSYINELHDSHSFIIGADETAVNFASTLAKKNTAGSYGLIISKTDGSRYIASYVEPNSPAYNAGMIVGAEILTWNSKPIAQALIDTDSLWSDEYESLFPSASFTPSTKASLDYEKMRMLTRDIIGAQANIVWRNPGQNITYNKILLAVDDHDVITNKTKLYSSSEVANSIRSNGGFDPGLDPSKQIIVNWLPNHYVQLKISDLSDGDYGDPDANEKESPLYLYFVKTMQEIVSKKPHGIIVDLRSNAGGDGRLAMDFAGFFTPTTQRSFHIKITAYNVVTKKYQPIPGWGPYFITGQTSYYFGPTVVLTDVGTLSAGEWAALSFQQIGKPILSFYSNTQGAFSGSIGSPFIVMPENFVIVFSSGKAFDQNNHLLVESNSKLEGGVKTDVLIPFDAKTAIDINTYDKDSALDFAIFYLEKHL